MPPSFKVGALVKYDGGDHGYSTPVMARVEGREGPGPRWRILVIPKGHRIVVPHGDIAHVQEDEDTAARAVNAYLWATGGKMVNDGGIYRGDRRGNHRTVLLDGDPDLGDL